MAIGLTLLGERCVAVQRSALLTGTQRWARTGHRVLPASVLPLRELALMVLVLERGRDEHTWQR